MINFFSEVSEEKEWFKTIPGSSRWVKVVPFHPKNPPKGRRSRYTISHGENYINISFCEFTLRKTNIFRLVFGGTYFGCSPLPVPAGNEAV